MSVQSSYTTIAIIVAFAAIRRVLHVIVSDEASGSTAHLINLSQFSSLAGLTVRFERPRAVGTPIETVLAGIVGQRGELSNSTVP